MVASKRFPVKTLLLSAGLSASLALLGCATNGLSSHSQVVPVGPGPAANGTQQSLPAPAANQTPSGTYRYDWTTDRILRQAPGFKTASFVDSLKPNLDLPPVARQTRDVATSGGLANAFAKNLPGAEKLAANPNTPAVIGTTSYFLTGSTSSANVFALSSSGQVLWELSLHENGSFDHGLVSGGGSMAVGNASGVATLYAITDQGRLHAVNADTGIVRSFVEVPEDEFHKSSPFVISDGANDRIYLTSDDGRVYRYTFNGNSFSQDFEVEPVSSSNTGRFSSSAIVTGVTAVTSHIYVGSEEGKLYKLNPVTGTTISSLDLSANARSSGCQIMATLAIDSTQDVAMVPCGSHLFKVRLNDSSDAALALAAQSPLLELRKLITLQPARVLGPNHNTRPQLETTALREPIPTEASLKLEQNFGFKKGDFLRVETSTSGNIYGEVDTLTDQGEVTFKGDGLYPIASPSPDPILFGAEKVSLANMTVRPDIVDPDPEATPFPTPSPPPSGSDDVSRFQIGSPENLQAGDFLRFPTLDSDNNSSNGIQAVVTQICSSSNDLCELGGGGHFAGLERFLPDDDEDQAVFYVTVPGPDIQVQIEDELDETRFVPFEKLTNQVVGSSNAAVDFELASVKDFRAGDTVRVIHQNDSASGRYEYGTVETVTTSTRRLRLISPLSSVPAAGDRVEIIDANDRAFGRVTVSQLDSNGNILADPVLRGNGQEVYVQHGNTLYELNYASDTSFKDSANYLILQSGRLEQSNMSLSAQSRSHPLIDPVSFNKLVTVDADPSGKSGIFLNRVLLPLSSTNDRLNDLFPILAPNSLGQLPNRAETRPVLLGGSGFVMFGGGNGVAYKLHKDIAW
ncbi:MAG: PQQ-binding-like beta-propeller repeat protein [Candidatus Sericytochromatia bacterium]